MGYEEGPFELKEELGLRALNWVEDEESEAGVEVWEAGGVVDPVALVWAEPVRRSLLLWAVKSLFCCSSATFCADSWSCTCIMWEPTPMLMVRGARPHRKSLICQEQNINKS